MVLRWCGTGLTGTAAGAMTGIVGLTGIGTGTVDSIGIGALTGTVVLTAIVDMKASAGN
jgi:hypothetical protein